MTAVPPFLVASTKQAGHKSKDVPVWLREKANLVQRLEKPLTPPLTPGACFKSVSIQHPFLHSVIYKQNWEPA